MVKLYEIKDQYVEALNDLGALYENGEIEQDALTDTLEALQGDFEEKAKNVAAYCKNLEAEIEAHKQAEKSIAARRRAKEKKLERLMYYIKTNMESIELKQIDTPYFAIAIKHNPAKLVIDDDNAIPDKYKQLVQDIKIDKAGIKKAYKDEPVPGCHLEPSTRLEIK